MRENDEGSTMTDEMILDRRNGDIRPVPDPTALTSVALGREIVHLKELVEEKFSAVKREMHLVENSRVEQKQDSLYGTELLLHQLLEMHDLTELVEEKFS